MKESSNFRFDIVMNLWMIKLFFIKSIAINCSRLFKTKEIAADPEECETGKV